MQHLEPQEEALHLQLWVHSDQVLKHLQQLLALYPLDWSLLLFFHPTILQGQSLQPVLFFQKTQILGR